MLRKLLIALLLGLSIGSLRSQDNEISQDTVSGLEPYQSKRDTSKTKKGSSKFFQSYPLIPKGKTEINFVGQGNLQESFAKQNEVPISTGIGVFFRQYFGKAAWENSPGLLFLYGIEVEAIINVASTLDSVTAEYENGVISNREHFGASVLTPLNSGKAGILNLRGYFREKLFWGIVSGIETHFSGSSLDYKLAQTSVQSTIIDYNITLFHEFIPMDKREDFSVTFGIGVNARNIGGDIKNDEAVRMDLFNTKTRFFIGPHVRVGLRLKNLKAELYNNWLYPSNDASGLAGNQIITAISFTGGFPLKLE